MTSEGFCSWYKFGREIFAYTKTIVILSKATVFNPPVKILIPKYSVLENLVLKNLGINKMGQCKVALHSYLNEQQKG
ncbi:MAG: hypothetical protein H7296_05055 [Bacteroidia bacterium]|nr:hypothetical protein [Bacteroidia bacterium]